MKAIHKREPTTEERLRLMEPHGMFLLRQQVQRLENALAGIANGLLDRDHAYILDLPKGEKVEKMWHWSQEFAEETLRKEEHRGNS